MSDRRRYLSLQIRPGQPPGLQQDHVLHHEHDAVQANWNLFARLTPAMARQLHMDAVQTARSIRQQGHGELGFVDGWNVERDGRSDSMACTSGVEFLPLQVDFPNGGKTVYVSYNGGDLVVDPSTTPHVSFGSRRAKVSDTSIELPACIVPNESLNRMVAEACPSVGLSNVIVTALPSVANAAQLWVEPVSSQDWILFQQHATWLEGGGLLQQVCLVYSDQVVLVQLPLASDASSGPHSTPTGAQFRVLQKNFLGNPHFWPAVESDGGEGVREYVNSVACLRLVADTEFIMSPPRHKDPSNGALLLQIVPTMQDYSPKMRRLADQLDVPLPQVPMYSAALHPHRYQRLLVENGNFDDVGSLLAVVQVVDSKRREGIGSTWARRIADVDEAHDLSADVSTAVEARTATVRLLACPTLDEDHIALHPILRQATLKGRLFEDLQIISLMTQLSAQTQSRALVEQIECRDAPVQFARIFYPSPEESFLLGCPVWRRPVDFDDAMDLESKGIPSLDAESCLHYQNASWTPSAQLSEAPVDVQGGIVLVSSSKKTEDGADSIIQPLLSYLRLSRPNGPIQATMNQGGRFILLKDLIHLLRRASKATENTPVAPVTISEQVQMQPRMRPSRPPMLNLLPSRFVLLPSWLDAVQKISPRPQRRHRQVILVHGNRGSGKTTLAILIASTLQLQGRGTGVAYVDCRKLQATAGIRMQDILMTLCQLFQDAATSANRSNGQTTVILDELDQLAPAMVTVTSSGDSAAKTIATNPLVMDQSKLICDVVRHLLDVSYPTNVIFTSERADSLAPSLVSHVDYMPQCQVPPLHSKDRVSLLERYLGEGIIVPDIEQRMDGYRPRDVERLAYRAIQGRNRRRSDSPKLAVVLSDEISKFLPLSHMSAAREDLISSTADDASWTDIGGLFHVKNELVALMFQPSRYRRIYDRLAIPLPRGILLFGPPGCGKSYLVPALARQCGFRLISCRGPAILDRYIGASEAKVRALFDRAATAAPSILFLDEIDALAPRRGSDSTGVTDRIVNQLLTYLDGVESLSTNGSVYIVAATSRPDCVDPALLRPGRLERHLYVGYPEDSDQEWQDLLIKIAGSFRVDDALIESIKSGGFAEYMMDKATYVPFSPADVVGIFRGALVEAVNERCPGPSQQSISDSFGEDFVLTARHLKNSFHHARPSMSQRDHFSFQQKYNTFGRKAVRTARSGGPDAASGGGGGGGGSNALPWIQDAEGTDQPVLRVALR